MINKSKEEIIRDLQERAASWWGSERAEALGAKIEQTAGWMELVGQESLRIGEDEPDLLVAPARVGEVG